MTRFLLDDLVELGDGWARHAEPGEELFRLRHPFGETRWMPEDVLVDIISRLSFPGLTVECMVAP